MNCTDVAAILDDHALSRLSAADRCALDEHVTACEPCGHAWHAQTALLAVRVPVTPIGFVSRMLRAADTRPQRRAQRARRRAAVVGAAFAAGAALAAVTVTRLLERTGEENTRTTANARAPSDSPVTPVARQQSSVPTASPTNTSDATAVTIDDVQSEYVMAIRVPPEYPREALRRKVDGDVTVEYTIDDHGAVKEAHAVRSSDPLFEAPAIAAVSQWKYLPRVVAGKRVAAEGVQTVLRFQFDSQPPPRTATAANLRELLQAVERTRTDTKPSDKASPVVQAPALAHPADYMTLDRSIAVAWQRSSVDDFRGAELELDELRATYDLDGRQTNQVFGFYGYIYTQYKDYGRAIDAYEKAVAAVDSAWPGQWTSLASLYFARHQYDMALKTLLRFRDKAAGRIGPDATAMIEKLRALGVTEETL